MLMYNFCLLVKDCILTPEVQKEHICNGDIFAGERGGE